MKKIFTLIVLIAISQSIFGQKQNLGFNLTLGKTYYLTIHASSSIKQDLNEQKINIDLNISGKTAFKVINIIDTLYEMAVNYETLAMTMKLPNGEITFDSEKQDDANIFSKILTEMTGKEFSLKMNKVGKIIEIKDLDKVFENAIEQFPNLSSQQKEQVKAQIMQSYGEKAFKGSYETATNIYSNTAVEKGDTWTINSRLESGMGVNITTIYEFKDKIENYKLIVGNGKLETTENDAYIQINGMPTRYNLKGTINTTLKVDDKTGWIIESKITQLMSGNVEIKDNPKLPGGMIIPMSIESITNSN
ncbi:MAG: hypothetical protein KA313_03775 [Pseudarcicella sp.]|nr:hypothetical protein [Pseudarcicella sp.]MBP6410194.1 hypothetical protein [Pseudarcicella sp.]